MKNIIITCLILPLLLPGCTKDAGYIINDGLLPDNVIQITKLLPNTSVADSTTEVRIRVNINKNADHNAYVTLTTSLGYFNNQQKKDSAQVNADRYAEFVLRTGQQPGIADIRASVLGSFYRDTTLQLAKSYPDSVIVISDSYTLQQNTVLHVAISLFKAIGYPSKNQVMQYRALDASGNPVGNFTVTNSYSPGAPLDATFTPANNYTGTAILQVHVVKENGTRVIGATTIQVI